MQGDRQTDMKLSPERHFAAAAHAAAAAAWSQAAAINLRHLGCTDSRVLRLCVFELLLAPRRFLGDSISSSSANSSNSSSSSGSSGDGPSFDLVFLCPPYTEVVYGDLLKVSLAAAALGLLLLLLLLLLCCCCAAAAAADCSQGIIRLSLGCPFLSPSLPLSLPLSVCFCIF